MWPALVALCERSLDIERLAGSLVFLRRLSSSPYADLALPEVWDEVEHAFVADYCSVAGFAQESPLYVWYGVLHRTGCRRWGCDTNG